MDETALIVEAVQTAARRNNLTMEQLAEELDISVATLYRFKHRTLDQISLDTAIRLFGLAGISIDQLMGQQPAAKPVSGEFGNHTVADLTVELRELRLVLMEQLQRNHQAQLYADLAHRQAQLLQLLSQQLVTEELPVDKLSQAMDRAFDKAEGKEATTVPYRAKESRTRKAKTG